MPSERPPDPRLVHEIDELSDRTGQPLPRIEEDTDRDFFMSPAEAVEYGLIDKVIEKRGA